MPDYWPAKSTVGGYQDPLIKISMVIDGTYDFSGTLGPALHGSALVYNDYDELNPAFPLSIIDGFDIGMNPDPEVPSAFNSNVFTSALSVDLYDGTASIYDSDAIAGLVLNLSVRKIKPTNF